MHHKDILVQLRSVLHVPSPTERRCYGFCEASNDQYRCVEWVVLEFGEHVVCFCHAVVTALCDHSYYRICRASVKSKAKSYFSPPQTELKVRTKCA